MITAYSVKLIAQVCHEANRAICEAAGDHSQRSWDEAEEWQRDSAIKGVYFALDNPTAPASAQHDAWASDKVAAGWTFGIVKDAEAKTHPCLVPYDQLPFEQQAKDYVFKAIVGRFVLPERIDPPFDEKGSVPVSAEYIAWINNVLSRAREIDAENRHLLG